MLRIYSRVSTIEQAGDGTTSLAEQVRKGQGWAMMGGLGKFDISVYEDAGVSGATPLRERTAGAAMLADAEKGDTLLASKLDRMFRDSLDALEVYTFCRDKGIDLVLLDLGNESCIRDGLAKCFFTIISAFADMERWRIAERMADGRRGKAAKQGFLGGSEPPYGFKVEGAGREARLVPVEQEQYTIQTIVALAEHHRPAALLKELEKRKIRRRHNAPFGFMQVKRILEREGRAQ